MNAAVAPRREMLSSTFPRLCGTGILADQPQHQDTDRAYGGRSARMPGPGPAGVPARDHIAVPAEHGIRAHHQVQSLEHVPREPVQQRRQQRPISRGEPATCPDRVAAAGPRAGGAARGSLRLCPGCSSAAAATVRTHLPYQGRFHSPAARALPWGCDNWVPSRRGRVRAAGGWGLVAGGRAGGGEVEGAQLCWRAARRRRFALDRSRPEVRLAPGPHAG